MYQMLDSGEWLITANCDALVRVLPTLTRDPLRVEDIKKCEGDDPADAARYGLKSGTFLQTARPPLEQRITERVTSGDPTIRAIQIRRAFANEIRLGHPIRLHSRHSPQDWDQGMYRGGW
jgi:hypothetical protein